MKEKQEQFFRVRRAANGGYQVVELATDLIWRSFPDRDDAVRWMNEANPSARKRS